MGPSLAAAAVIASVRAATASMRTHRSHYGGAARAIPGSGLPIRDAANTKMSQAAKPAMTTSFPNRRATTEKAKKAAVADARAATHPVLLEAAAYGTANAASPIRPKRIPTAGKFDRLSKTGHSENSFFKARGRAAETILAMDVLRIQVEAVRCLRSTLDNFIVAISPQQMSEEGRIAGRGF